jgi:glycosyltransferase involved in cell wall biosynthesis
MRILVATGLTHWGVGGVERETDQLLASLVKHGVATGFVVDRNVGHEGVDWFPLTYPPGPRASDELKSAIDRFRPNLVHVIGGGVRMMLAARRAVRVPWVGTVHNVPPRERTSPVFHGRNSLYYGARTALSVASIASWSAFLRSAPFAAAIVHSSTVGRDVARLGCPTQKIRLISLGADLAADVPQSRAATAFPAGAFPKILTVAGLIHHKGFHDYLEVVLRLRRRLPKVHYAIVGTARDHRYSRFLSERVRELGLAENVSFTLGASDEQRDGTLADADLYVQPSHEEGFCLTFAEAMSRVPRVLGTRTGAMVELAEAAGGGGIQLVAPRSVRDLETATLALLDANLEAGPILAARRSRLRDSLSWAQHGDAHIALYEQVLEQSP